MSRQGEFNYNIKYIYSSLLTQCHGKLDLDKHDEGNEKVTTIINSKWFNHDILESKAMLPTVYYLALNTK